MDVVTGATGHLGNVLVRSLEACGRRVRAIARAGSDCAPLEGLDVEIARADILDRRSLETAFRGAERVFHAAGHVSFGVGDHEALRAVNVDGTTNVLRACAAAGVRRLVYVGSIEAFDLTSTPGALVTEQTGIHPDRTMMEYGRSKAIASLAVLEAVRAGLDALVVCPTGYIGPYDYRLSAMGRLVVDYVSRRLPAIVEGGFDFVDVRDVADGTIRAAEAGRAGELYILSGTYLTVAEIMAALEARTGVPGPMLVLPGGLARIVARVAEVWSALWRSPPRFTTASVGILSLGVSVSCEKARRELGYEPRPFAQTLEDTLAWFAEAGLLPEVGEAREADT